MVIIPLLPLCLKWIVEERFMVSQPPQVDCKERVALDLMQTIAADECERGTKKAERDEDARGYWLRLYRQCLAVVNGAAYEERSLT